MAWTVDELVRWLDESEPQIDRIDPFAWLELTPDATLEQVQPAFHAVARTRHPDVWRLRLSPAELDRLVRLYARVTAAYAELRDPARHQELARKLRRLPPLGPGAPPAARAQPAPMAAPRPQGTPAAARGPAKPVAPPPPPVVTRAPRPVQVSRAPTPAQVSRVPTPAQVSRVPTPAPVAPAPTPAEASAEPARSMNTRALGFYRRAEGALRVGDRATALLHLRMAIAADPSSALLRAALAEVLADR